MLSVTEVSLDSFGIGAVSEQGRLTLTLTGTGDMAAVEPLKKCLAEVRNTARQSRVRELEVDVRALYLLNSSCIKAFVHFLYLLQTDGPMMSVRFLVDKNLGWQARALTALMRMAPDIVSISAS